LNEPSGFFKLAYIAFWVSKIGTRVKPRPSLEISMAGTPSAGGFVDFLVNKIVN
jgi:hypothetical protein